MVTCSSSDNNNMHAMVLPPPPVSSGSGNNGGGASDWPDGAAHSSNSAPSTAVSYNQGQPHQRLSTSVHSTPLRGVSGRYGGVPPPPEFPPPAQLLLRGMPPPVRGSGAATPHFFIREIYKNGFLKRLPYNEKKSSALAKLMKTDRFWVVFSVHDDLHPFLELWHEPTEVAHRPPVHVFPLAACQHISTSIVPAGDNEWSFVINFDMAVAIRFSCNSREAMADWVEVIRAKLADMGILNPRGNLYSRTPLGPPAAKPVVRDPTSPLPQPPPLEISTPTAATVVASGEPAVGATANCSASMAADDEPQPEAATTTAASMQQQGNAGNANSRHATSPTRPVSQHPPSVVATTQTSTAAESPPTTTRTKAVIETHHHATSSSSSSSSFTTSIYLNRKTSLPAATTAASASSNSHNKTKVAKSLSSMLLDVKIAAPGASPADFGGSSGGATSSVYLNQSSPTRHVTVIPVNSGESAVVKDDDEDNKATVAPLADLVVPNATSVAPLLDVVENHTYGAIFPLDDTARSNDSGPREKVTNKGSRSDLRTSPVRRQQHQPHAKAPTAPQSETSPTRRGRERTTTRPTNFTPSQATPLQTSDVPPPLPERPVALFRRLSDRRHQEALATMSSEAGCRLSYPHNITSNNNSKSNNNNKIRRKARRSSSLGPFLADRIGRGAGGGNHQGPSPPIDLVGASTLSLESVDSNPRQAVPRAEVRRHGYSGLGAIPRRPLLLQAAFSPPRPGGCDATGGTAAVGGGHEPLSASNSLSSPSRPAPPPFYHHPLIGGPPPPLAAAGAGVASGGFPPMVPLPGLTCQLSAIPPGLNIPAAALHSPEGTGAVQSGQQQQQQRSLLEQQVLRMRQEIAHPAGVRLILRKKDVQNSLALVDLFGCVWVVGWKQREHPVLFNAFHIGDQILSVSGIIIRNSSEFSKLVKLKSSEPHTEIIIRRVPFAQIFHLKSEIEGQSLGILTHTTTPEIKEILPGSVAAQAGLNAKIRRIDGQALVPLVITELNGRPISLFSKDGEAWERLQSWGGNSSSSSGGREVSVLLQPADILEKMRKQFKSLRSYKDFILT